MADNPSVRHGGLPFAEQIDFFRRKAEVGTRGWTDLWRDQHNSQFMVAGAMKADLVADLKKAVDSAIADGTTLQTFRKNFDAIVKKHGWAYKGNRNWRTRVIFETNIRTSYAAGQYRQMTEPTFKKLRPFWKYDHSDFVARPRAHHLAWDGLILSADDPWWDTHYPPNGWGCQCQVEPLTAAAARRQGIGKAPALEPRDVYVPDGRGSRRVVRVPSGIDPGWDYAHGKTPATVQTERR